MARPAWQLPVGVTPGLWEYLTSPALAQGYDASLRDAVVAKLDEPFILQRLPAQCDVLDLGCGTGRLLPGLVAAGYNVVGVDLSEPMLENASSRWLGRADAPAFIRGNLCDLSFLKNGSFDACICTFATLGMVTSATARSQVLREVQRVLRPGGRFIFHVHARWHSLRFRQSRGQLLRGAWLTGDVVLPPHQGLSQLSMHLFTKGELRRLVARSGFKLGEIRNIGNREDGTLAWPSVLQTLRAMGFFVVVDKT